MSGDDRPIPRLTEVPTVLDDRSRSDAQTLVCYQDAHARRRATGEPIDELLMARVQAIVDDFGRYGDAMDRLVEAKIPIAVHELPAVTRVAQV